ncbi:MAG TPA: protein-disulfide reductase DsbD [Melioribacteraceae bacterium]|nr:protein-disulfide reductase DsbD [Melioribacteraceae bacterium]
MTLKNLLVNSFSLLLLSSVLLFSQPQVVSVSLDKNILKAQAGSSLKVVLNAKIDNTWHINSNKPNDEFLIPSVIAVKGNGLKLSSVKYPVAHDISLSFSDTPVSVYEGDVKFELTIAVDKSAAPGKQNVEVKLNYQACNDQSCLPPTSVKADLELEILPAANAAVEEPRVIDQTEEPVQSIEPPVTQKVEETILPQEEIKKEEDSLASTLESSGIFLSLFFVFLGGLALNLTPCVYPLIPITIGYFGGQAEGKTSRLFLLGILYVLGMALTYSVIGVITSLSGAVFGTLLQNPFVIAGIALLFIVLALSQFGVYEFKLPDKLVMKAGGAKGGVMGAFFMGLTMGIVAAPCIGPFVLGLVTYVAAKGDPFYGFLMFFVLALGLGFPYLLLALFSGKIKKLPRAGDWMEGVKHIFGFLLLGMAFFFVDPILPKSIQGYALPVFGIIAAVILLFVDKTANQIKGFRIFKTVFSVIVLAVSIWALIPSEKLSPEWQQFSIASYEESLKNNEAMLIDFYADWCIPCKELDALTFSDPRVIKELESYTSYKVDMTQMTEANEELRKKFNVIGMPTVLIINSKGEEVHRLTGFVNADEFLKLLTD